MPIYGRSGEESFRAQLFVSALGASGCAYAEATRTQQLADWLASHVRALEYYRAAPTIIVPDNPRVSVTRADRYELPADATDVIAYFQTLVPRVEQELLEMVDPDTLEVAFICRSELAS